MAVKLIVNGAAGRMGKRIIALASENSEIDIVGAVDWEKSPEIGKDAGTAAGVEPLGVEITSEYPDGADAVIDFSLPQATDKLLEFCVDKKVPLVLCTTGLSDQQIENVRKAAQTIPIMRASNMSVGMNLLFTLVGRIAATLGPDYDIEITEAHHRFKKDAPSGTAMTLAEKIAEGTGRTFPDCLQHGREGKDALREAGTIGMHALRGGDITGEHSVFYSTLGETITISHSAHSRDTFARGSLRAGVWIKDQKPGLYDMADCLGLEK